MRYVGLLLLGGCSSTSPSPETPFEYTANVHWDARSTPEVTSVTIGGHTISSAQPYLLEASYPSYDDAQATFTPVPVIVTTTTQMLTFTVNIGRCGDDAFLAPETFTKETDQVYVSYGPWPNTTTLGLDTISGSCETTDGRNLEWAE